MPFNEFPEPEKVVTWSELQAGLSEDAGLDTVPGFTAEQTKQASSHKELIQTQEDALWAGSALLSEDAEIERHIDGFVKDKTPYMIMERSLMQLGYGAPKIRSSFFRITGIDPIRAYLDFTTYPIPPDGVPRYNYGWGNAKGSETEYYFVLPWINKYALYRQKGFERELVEDFWLLHEAREALSKKVQRFHDVTPEATDTLSTFIQKIAEVAKLSEKGAEFYEKMAPIASYDPDFVARTAVQAFENGVITEADFKAIAKTVLAAPSNSTLVSAPERIDERQFNDFRSDMEGRSFQEMKDNAAMPGQMFSDSFEQNHKVSLFGLLAESEELFNELIGTIQGYTIEPMNGSFRVMPEPTIQVDDDNHILDGGMAIGATIKKLGDEDEAEIMVLMFIHSGKLRYTGKFKGTNNREYAFTTQGVGEYFEDLQGSSLLDQSTSGPGDMGIGTGQDSGASGVQAPHGF